MNMKRYGAFGIWLLFIAACVFIISRTSFNADMSAFLPRTPTPTQQIMVEQLRDGVVSRMILVGLEGAPEPQLAQLSKAMAARLRGEGELATVNNGERVGLEKDFELLWQNRYFLSDAVTPQRFSVQGLGDSLNNYLDLLSTPMSGMAQQVLPKDPSGELVHLLEQLEGQTHPLTQDDVWFSRDGKRAMLLVQTKGAGSDIDAQERAMLLLKSAFEASLQALQGGQGEQLKANLLLTGPGVFSVQSRASIRDDAWQLSLIATLLVASMLLMLYRSPRVLVLGLLPVASGALAGVAAVSLGFGSVHGLTLGFGVTLIGEGVDYAIYLFTQIERNSTAQTTLRRIWPTLRLGVLTSICGFSAMLFSGFTGLAQLGLFSIAGLLAAVGTTRWVLPGLLPAGFAVHPPARLSSWAMVVVRVAPRARFALALLVLAALALLWGKRDGLWNDSLASMSPISVELQTLDQQMRDDMGAPDVRYMLILSAQDQESVLQQGEDLTAILRGQVQQGLLEGYDTAPLPSRRTQLARQAALPDAKVLQQNFEQALHGSPFKRDTFAAFPQEIARAKQQKLLDREALAGTAFGLKLDSFLLQRESGWVLMLPLRGLKDAAHLVENVRRQTAVPFVLLDMKNESDQMFHEYRQEASKYSMLGALAIVLLLFVSLRSARRVFEVLLPLLAAVVVVSAWLMLRGQSLSIFHLIGLLLVVAVGSNYALFFDQVCESQDDRKRTVTSLLFANISTVLGFGLLSFSQSPVLNAIGFTVALGAVLSLVFSAILITRGNH